jgi:hypothetical protein
VDPSGATAAHVAVAAIVALATSVVPGYAMGYGLLGLRRLPLLAASLPLTAGAIGLLTIVVAPTPLPWVPTAAAALILLTAISIAVALRRRGTPAPARTPGEGPDETLGRRARRQRSVAAVGRAPRAGSIATAVALAAALVVLVAVTASGLAGLGIGQPIEHRDAAFHYTATALIGSGGATPFPLGGLDAMFPGSSGVYYPSLWHAMAAFPSVASDAVVGSHVLVLVVSWWFFVAVAALARVAAPRLPYAPAFAVVVALSATAFPYTVMNFHGQWPSGLSLVLVLVVLVLGVLLVQRPSDPRRWVAAAVTFLGAVLAHGSAAAVVLLAVTTLVSALLLHGALTRRPGLPAGPRAGMVAAGILVPFVMTALVVLAVRTVPLLGSMADFERVSVDRRGEVTQSLLFQGPVPPHIGPQSPAWVLAALGLVGVVALLRHRFGTWLVLTAVGIVVLRVCAAGEDSVLRDLTAAWYKDYDRLEALLVAPAAVIAGAGGALLVGLAASALDRQRTGRGVQAAGAVVGAVVVVGAIAASTGLFRWSIATDTVRQGPRQAVPEDRVPALDTEEAAWLRDLADAPGEGSRVLGSPASGLVFAPALVGWDVLPLPLYPAETDRAVLALQGLPDALADPAECERLADLGVTHVYLDSTGQTIIGYSFPLVEEIPPGVLEPVATEGTAGLYTLVGCP